MQPFEWICISIIGLFTMVINILIFQQECKRRKLKQVKFTCEILQLSAFVCIGAGILFGFAIFVAFFDGICHIMYHLVVAMMAIQAFGMGCYQLSRLHYCFSQTKVYSKTGYPNWLFILMYIIGVLWCIYAVISPWFWIDMFLDCGIDKQFQFYTQGKSNTIITGHSDTVRHTTFYLVWDFGTLLLYIIKIISFQKYKFIDIDTYKHIMSILNRILILTILYEITGAVALLISIIHYQILIIRIAYWLSWGLVSIMLSCSMFLMQPHNIYQYRKLLKMLYASKLYYLCCCCVSIIRYEIEADNTEKENTYIEPEDNTEKENTHTDSGTTANLKDECTPTIKSTQFSHKESQDYDAQIAIID
eukprot:359500_1